jgi:hypothetical protein
VAYAGCRQRRRPDAVLAPRRGLGTLAADASAIVGDSNPAVTLNGTSTGLVASGNTFRNPQTFSAEF